MPQLSALLSTRWITSSSLALPALLLINFWWKLDGLGLNDLSLDEPFTVYWSQRPLSEIWEMLRTENNPPLYLLLIKAWSAVIPFEAAWLRIPSAIFSALTVVPLYLLARRAADPSTALLAALLFTANNYHYGFAHEVRAYALFALLATTAMWLIWRAKDLGSLRGSSIAILALVNTLMVYTHFFGWLAIGVQGMCVFLLPEWRPLRRGFLASTAITAILFAPYLIVFAHHAGASVAHGTWLEAPVPEEVYNMIWRWSNAPVVAVLFLVLIILGCVRDRVRSTGLRFALIWTLVPLLGMYLVSQAVPIFLDRYLIYAAPGFALLVAVAIHHLGLRRSPSDLAPWFGEIVSLASVLAMTFTFTPWNLGVRQPSRVVKTVEDLCWEKCSVEVVPPWYWLSYLAAEDIDQLKDDQSDLLESGVHVPDRKEIGEVGPTVLVDASGDRAYSDVIARLRGAYPSVDSVETDHRVRVYRFH